ncbi:PIN domain-containing protein [Comamonas serinivorans]|uniref:PIN domain-containing protein n=1 Tax=Comamonas serinivorans TaxID=1082851 RepID=UPI0012F89AF7|nr:PIN domain-containing protein [Comamonas serinivorans]
MTAPVFVDASVLVAAENAHEPALQAACVAWLDALWAARAGRVSQDELVRFYDACTQQASRPLPQGDARAAIRRYQTWTAWALDAATLESAWAVQARLGLPFSACLTVAAAQHSGCAWLLSVSLGALMQGTGDRRGAGTDAVAGSSPTAWVGVSPDAPEGAGATLVDATLAGVHVLNPARVSPAQWLDRLR